MTAEQAAENIKAKIDELANKAAERMDALADVADDHDSVTAPSSTSSREVLVDFLLGEPR